MTIPDFKPTIGSNRQYVTRNPEGLGPIQDNGTVFLHMRPEAFSRNTAALFSVIIDPYEGMNEGWRDNEAWSAAYDWFQIANKGKGFCYL